MRRRRPRLNRLISWRLSPLSEEEGDKVLSINAGLEKDQKETTMALIRGHASSFAWRPSDMPRIDHGVMTYKLNILPGAKLGKQKKIVFGKEKQHITREEVQKLEKVRFIREIMYPQ